jgi:hypothetical protein
LATPRRPMQMHKWRSRVQHMPLQNRATYLNNRIPWSWSFDGFVRCCPFSDSPPVFLFVDSVHPKLNRVPAVLLYSSLWIGHIIKYLTVPGKPYIAGVKRWQWTWSPSHFFAPVAYFLCLWWCPELFAPPSQSGHEIYSIGTKCEVNEKAYGIESHPCHTQKGRPHLKQPPAWKICPWY